MQYWIYGYKVAITMDAHGRAMRRSDNVETPHVASRQQMEQNHGVAVTATHVWICVTRLEPLRFIDPGDHPT